jgi:hypothetical protein
VVLHLQKKRAVEQTHEAPHGNHSVTVFPADDFPAEHAHILHNRTLCEQVCSYHWLDLHPKCRQIFFVSLSECIRIDLEFFLVDFSSR